MVLPEDLRPETLSEHLSQVAGKVGCLSGNLLAQAPKRVKLFHTLNHGVDNLPAPSVLQALKERGLVIARANPSGINIAEFIMMQMIALCRRLVPLHEALEHRCDWSRAFFKERTNRTGRDELHGATLGLVRFGEITQQVTKRALAFGMAVGALVRHPAPKSPDRWTQFHGAHR